MTCIRNGIRMRNRISIRTRAPAATVEVRVRIRIATGLFAPLIRIVIFVLRLFKAYWHLLLLHQVRPKERMKIVVFDVQTLKLLHFEHAAWQVLQLISLIVEGPETSKGQ